MLLLFLWLIRTVVSSLFDKKTHPKCYLTSWDRLQDVEKGRSIYPSTLTHPSTYPSQTRWWKFLFWFSPLSPFMFLYFFLVFPIQSCLTLCDPIDGSPPGSCVPGILQARTLEWVAISFSNAWEWKLKVKFLSRVRLLATPWTAAYHPWDFPGKSTGVGCHCLLWRLSLDVP